MDTSLNESKSKYKVAHWIQEVARSIISFKLSGKTNLALSKNDRLVDSYLVARESHFRVLVIQFIQMIGFKVLVTAGLLLIGGFLVLDQQINIGQFVAAEIIILLVINSVEKLIRGLETVYDLLTSLEKLGQVVDMELEDQYGEKPLSEDEPLKLELSGVSFSAPNSNKIILEDINLNISPKESLLILGANGSGKTTLLRMISGIISPDLGNIYVNDISLSGININHYRSFLGQSLTEENPFEGTILENITMGDSSISQKDLYWALENVGLLQFIKDQPNGLKTALFPEGKQIPYTISKKIILARSIVRKPKILILKDPLNQLDEIESIRIMNFLLDNNNPWALVVVSQDQKWIDRCKRIITMDHGKIVSET